MEDLRNYLANSNGDIFEIINKAIRVAASDYPLEFQSNKHKIAETLYSSSLMKCPGRCDDVAVSEQNVAKHGSSKNHMIKPPPTTTESLTLPKRTNVIRIKLKKKAQDGDDKSSGVKPTGEKQVFQSDSGKTNGRVTAPDRRKSTVIDSKMATKNQKGGNSSIEEKFEATKRKLQHNYEEAENMKKQRRVHVLEFHELSRHGLLPHQQRQVKSSNEQLKRRANVHSRIPRLVSTY